MKRLAHGDLGESLFYGVPAPGRLVVERLPVTLWLIGLRNAALDPDRRAARRDRGSAIPRRAVDHVVRAVPLVGLGLPAVLDRDHAAARRSALHLGRLFPVGGYGEGFLGHVQLDVPARR